MTKELPFSPFRNEELNSEYKNWLLHKPELIDDCEIFDSRPICFLCDQIALQVSNDRELLSTIQLLQETLCWRSVGEEYKAQVDLVSLVEELRNWTYTIVETLYDPESAVPTEKLIRAGSAVYAADFLYPGHANKIYEVANILWDIDVEFLKNVTPIDLAQIYLERVIIKKVGDKLAL